MNPRYPVPTYQLAAYSSYWVCDTDHYSVYYNPRDDRYKWLLIGPPDKYTDMWIESSGMGIMRRSVSPLTPEEFDRVRALTNLLYP